MKITETVQKNLILLTIDTTLPVGNPMGLRKNLLDSLLQK